MGFYVGTKVSCTNPELLATGSTFNQEWFNSIVSIEKGVTFYHCSKTYLNDALAELSRSHPEVTFSGCTWIDDDYEDAKDYTFILRNGIYEYVDMAPHYQILFPVIEDEEYNSLTSRFVKQIEIYLQRIDIIKKTDEEDIVFDFPNDKEDQDGFVSYYTITWENDIHKFTATKRFTSMVIVDYERKNSVKKKEMEIKKDPSDKGQDDVYENLPF